MAVKTVPLRIGMAGGTQIENITKQVSSAVADAGLDADAYLYRDKSGDAFLPWQIIDGGMKESFFRAEMDKSLRAEWTVSGG